MHNFHTKYEDCAMGLKAKYAPKGACNCSPGFQFDF